MLTFGDAVLQASLSDLAAGVREDLGPNDGRRIREMAANVGCEPPINWCAAAVSSWIVQAASQLGVDSPVKPSAAARGLMANCMAAGLWVPWHKLEPDLIVPGSIIVWWRVSPTDWRGHVGIVESLDAAAPRVVTIEGNSGVHGDEVARMQRDLFDDHLLGIGCFGAQAEPTSTDLEQIEKWKDLSAEVMLEGEPRDPLAHFESRHR